MKLIPTSNCIFVTLDCYSSSEDISNTFEFAIQSNECEKVNDKTILREIEKISFDYDYDEMTVKVVERDFDGHFVERVIYSSKEGEK